MEVWILRQQRDVKDNVTDFFHLFSFTAKNQNILSKIDVKKYRLKLHFKMIIMRKTKAM